LFIAYALDHLNAPTTMELLWSDDNGATFSDPASRDSSGGEVSCPKLFETSDGQLLIVDREGNALNPPQRTVAIRYDVTSNAFGDTVTIDEDPIVCSDTARTSNGRQFVTSTLGVPGQPSSGVTLRYSDDGGLTWSYRYAIPGMSPNAGCPLLAASDDELYVVWRDAETFLLSRVTSPAGCP
jgi:hypothetical protein